MSTCIQIDKEHVRTHYSLEYTNIGFHYGKS